MRCLVLGHCRVSLGCCRAWVLVLVFSCFLFLVVPVSRAVQYAGEGKSVLQLQVKSLTSIITPQSSHFGVSLTVSNSSDLDLRGTLQLSLSRRTPVNRLSVYQWMVAARTGGNPMQVFVSQPDVVVSGHRSVSLDLSVPVEDIPLGLANDWGPRFLELSFIPQVDGVGGSSRANFESAGFRTLLLWDSGVSFEPSKLLVLAPVTATSADVANAGDLVGEGGLPNLGREPARRLVEVCRLASRYPLTLVYDPYLLESDFSGLDQAQSLLGFGAGMSGGDSAHPVAASFSDLKNTGKCGTREYAYLPPADFAASHTAVLPESERQRLSAAANETAALISAKIPDYREKMLLWPSSEGFVGGTGLVDYSAELSVWGTRFPLVLDDSSRYSTFPDPLSYDLDSRREVTVDQDTQTLGWAADPEISALLNGDFHGLGSADDFDVPVEFDAIQLRQWALASTAILTRQRPFDSRLFVGGLGRNYDASPVQSTVLDGLSQARWLEFPQISQVDPDSRGSSTIVPVRDGSEGQVSVLKQFSPYVAAERLMQADALSAAVKDPGSFESMFNALALSEVCSTCLSLHSGQVSLTGQILGLVQAQPASTINLLDKSVQIPISVSNRLNQPVTVRLVLTPSDSRLQVQSVSDLTVPSRSTASARVPVRAVGSGNVEVKVGLHNLDGQSIGGAEVIKVRVRAEWESMGTWVVAVVLGLVVVYGVLRRVVKGKNFRGDSAGLSGVKEFSDV